MGIWMSSHLLNYQAFKITDNRTASTPKWRQRSLQLVNIRPDMETIYLSQPWTKSRPLASEITLEKHNSTSSQLAQLHVPEMPIDMHRPNNKQPADDCLSAVIMHARPMFWAIVCLSIKRSTAQRDLGKCAYTKPDSVFFLLQQNANTIFVIASGIYLVSSKPPSIRTAVHMIFLL